MTPPSNTPPSQAIGPKNFGQNYITTNRFYVEMESELKASFTECSGLDVQIDKEVFSEGGVNEQQRVLLKQVKYGDITLKRGMTDDLTFWDWINKVLEDGRAERRNISILVFNQAGETMQSWTLQGAVPVAWKTPSFQADSSSVAIEELTLAYEGLKVESRGGGGVSKPLERDKKTGYFQES
ncbi:MAG: phage tail protein [Leptolyngbyaceae cyanobacterium MO_188.B28]|nr:phage tail protein [Leptolyngbyaceae cyanobacterium MO_188.B28]